MIRIEHTKCRSCAHYRELQRYGGTPTCAKAGHPMRGEQQFCAFAWERCEGRHWEARK
jgi:hypothetical protein